MNLIVVASERFAEHQTPPGHPERPERAMVMDAVAMEWRRAGGEVVAPRAVTGEQLARVHDARYLRRLDGLAGRAAALDPDTFTSPETIEIARLAAGAAIEGVERVMGGDRPHALALVRPPGHHAERDRAMGFCFYNNVAVAAAHARALGAGRVAIVDYDVHHGNGTQHMFAADPSVLYVSMHQYPYYPGTGAAHEVGEGPGTGYTVNVPLEAGATDEDYRVVFDEIVTPVLNEFAPELVLVSAGFDAHERDPLGGMRVTTAAFAAMTQELCLLAQTCCEGRLVAVTEGGYDAEALSDSLVAVTGVLGATHSSAPAWPASPVGSSRGQNAVSLATRTHSRFWKLTG